MLKDLQTMVDELNTTNSTNEKKEILKKYPQCKEMLRWVYNPYTKFWVTSELLKKRKDLTSDEVYQDITILLHMLNGRRITGHDAISAVNAFIEANKEYEELIYCIIDKNLKTRAQKLDEGLDIIQGLWSGEYFKYKGEHYQIRKTRFLPKPVNGTVPIFTSCTYTPDFSIKKPIHRAMKYNGLIIAHYEYPLKQVEPNEVKEMVNYVNTHRNSNGPFEFFLNGISPENLKDRGVYNSDNRQICPALLHRWPLFYPLHPEPDGDRERSPWSLLYPG